MGLKTAPFIATRSLQLVLNQENFQEFIKTLNETSLKAALSQLKLENLLICYIDDLLLATPKSLGVDLHLILLEYVLEMMCKFGFPVNKRKCSILSETVTFLGGNYILADQMVFLWREEIFWQIYAHLEVWGNYFAEYVNSVIVAIIYPGLINWLHLLER